MTVSVIIRRTLSDKEAAAKLAPLISKLRSLAVIQPGYISGQVFSCLDCVGEYMVISTWDSIENWNQWPGHEERMAIQAKIDDLLVEKTECRSYEPIDSGIVPSFE